MKNFVLSITFFLTLTTSFTQPVLKDNKFKLNFNEEGSHYIQMSFLGQVWGRYTQANPGSTVFGTSVTDIYDIGIRRWRLSLYGQLTDKVFFFTQFGQNNFSYTSKLYTGAFFHDAVIEFKIKPKTLSFGGGLTGWSGLSRYASPSVGSILGLDAPLYQQTTNSINDQFLRKLSFYAKGKLSKLDYRLIVTNPMTVQQATVTIENLSNNAEFSPNPPKLQTQGYFMWQFLDEESNLTPYTAGSYLGTKKVFNIGMGFIYQPEALWSTQSNGDTLYHAMQNFAIDIFYDLPLNEEKRNTLTLYAAYHNLNFGPKYIRNIGVMNPANGVNINGTFNGAGNGFPMIGTGNVYFFQTGYKFKDDLFKNNGTLQPYISSQVAQYSRLNDPMIMTEGGINWLLQNQHNGKITLNYQNRPVFTTDASGKTKETQRMGMVQLQLQAGF